VPFYLLTLYKTFTSDVPTTGQCEFATFADDTAIFVSDTDPTEVCGRLQRQLDTLSDYFKNWKIRVNPTKTQAIHFTKRTTSGMHSDSGLKLDDQEISWSAEVKYLYLDKRLTFASHTSESIKKAERAFRILYSFRIYSEFRGLLQDGFRILQIFLLNVSARCRQRTGTNSRRKTVGPTCIGWIKSELKRSLLW
jgi:hypothetical protein